MKPIKGLEPEREPNKVAVAIGAGALKIMEYAIGAVVFMAMTACVAFGVMWSLSIMHRHEPATPPFGFWFLWAAIWGSSLLALFAGGLVKNVLKEDE